MNQEPNEKSKHLEDSLPKSRIAFPAITNIAIIVLFFFTFMQVKSCSGKYHPVSGMELLQHSVDSFSRRPQSLIPNSPLLLTFATAILSLIFCLGRIDKLERRTSISGVIGGLCISFFIGICLMFGIKISLPPFLVAGLHFSNPLFNLIRRKSVR